MMVEIPEVTLTSVWQDGFNDRETGELVEYYRALLTVQGEPPMQVSVAKEDYEKFLKDVGHSGQAFVDVDAQPNRRVRVRLSSFLAG